MDLTLIDSTLKHLERIDLPLPAGWTGMALFLLLVVMAAKLQAVMAAKLLALSDYPDQVEAPTPWASLSIPLAATILRVHPHRLVSVQVLAQSKLGE
jgi:hypothetical protein